MFDSEGARLSFSTEGYALQPVFAPSVIADLQAEVMAHIDRVACALYLPFEHSEPGIALAERLDRVATRDPSYANLLRIAACTDAHRANAFARLARDPTLNGWIHEFLGAEPEGHVMRLRANLTALPEHRQHWHSDVALADGSDCSQVRVACWIPLMHAGPDSGGLELIAGHRDAPMPHRRDSGTFEIADADVRDLPRVQPDCPVGSVLFLDRYTPHRALKNRSGKARWSLVMWVKARPSDPGL